MRIQQTKDYLNNNATNADSAVINVAASSSAMSQNPASQWQQNTGPRNKKRRIQRESSNPGTEADLFRAFPDTSGGSGSSGRRSMSQYTGGSTLKGYLKGVP
jgi:hypothetical protein